MKRASHARQTVGETTSESAVGTVRSEVERLPFIRNIVNMCQARFEKFRGGATLPNETQRRVLTDPTPKPAAPASELPPKETPSTQPTTLSPLVESERPSDGTLAVLIGSSFFLVLVLLVFLYWIYRIELKKSNVRLPTSRFVLARRKLDSSSEQTPFRGVFGATARSSRYDSIPQEIPEPKILFGETLVQQDPDQTDPLELPSCSQSRLAETPPSPPRSLTRKRQQREQKIQERNLVFEKLLAGEEDFEIFVVHEERF